MLRKLYMQVYFNLVLLLLGRQMASCLALLITWFHIGAHFIDVHLVPVVIYCMFKMAALYLCYTDEILQYIISKRSAN